MLRRLLVGALVMAFSACGGGASQGPPPDTGGDGADPTDTADAVPEASPPPKAWEQMSFEAKQGYMMEKVMPAMEAKFQGHDPGEFSDFGCGTCHGEDARDREFEMPNPDLPALYPTGHPKQKQMVEEQKEMVTFMFQQVVPSMQTMLGAEPFDEATGEGFSCFSCHPKADVEGAAEGSDTADTADAEGAATGAEQTEAP